MTRYYRTVKAARGALALDTGFDPFTSGGWGRCTKAKLAEQGYVVDRKEAERIDRMIHEEHLCQEPGCLAQLKQEWTGMDYEWPTHCGQHRRWGRECDNGHKWESTDAEDKAMDHKCPKCGEYWV